MKEPTKFEQWVEVTMPMTGDYTDKMKVDGGWIYRTILMERNSTKIVGVAMCFVPIEPKYE